MEGDGWPQQQYRNELSGRRPHKVHVRPDVWNIQEEIQKNKSVLYGRYSQSKITSITIDVLLFGLCANWQHVNTVCNPTPDFAFNFAAILSR